MRTRSPVKHEAVGHACSVTISEPTIPVIPSEAISSSSNSRSRLQRDNPSIHDPCHSERSEESHDKYHYSIKRGGDQRARSCAVLCQLSNPTSDCQPLPQKGANKFSTNGKLTFRSSYVMMNNGLAHSVLRTTCNGSWQSMRNREPANRRPTDATIESSRLFLPCYNCPPAARSGQVVPS